MLFAVALAYNEPEELPALARAAEEAGFGSVILSDHLVYPETLATPYPYTRSALPPWQPDTPWPDPFVAAASLAAVTTRLRFIVSVFVLPMRDPALAAKTVMTTAVMTGGRLELGVGVGWMREEFDLVDIPFATRGRRLDEAMEVLRKFEAGGVVEHRGEFFDIPPLRMEPVPKAPIPIYGGGVSPRALRRAATRCDGWAGMIQRRAELPGLLGELRRLRADSPRAEDPFSITTATRDAIDEAGYREMESLGITNLITAPWVFYGVDTRTGTCQEKCDGIRRFGEEVLAKLGYAAPSS
jgi:probable F420-dependent oxidoreductase